MTRCKECSYEDETDHVKCPVCGAKIPHKIPLIIWLMLIVFAVLVGMSFLKPTPDNPIGAYLDSPQFINEIVVV
ncbi:MAG: hypothetical protein HKP09_10065 [Enterobacterales bacterium]|nr:hypothetical protein [Enterobacterales bacterium]